ncbi:hypothetical protein [Rhizobium sp. BK176]|uniref:hypothetical protein n=1 Tax=Rhizobium sp. BK176 TaxID=2587071 RepID=UPI0021674DFF|nr:hypothetical protein [Rhizobium sp. BK176]MCS4089243.1 hypothetical protein [Rhizobium sp. BK176]
MKYSKAAMTAHHVQFGQMAMMQPSQHAGERAAERPSGPARTYSTERYAPRAINNGVPIPQQLRDRIEASMKKPDPAPEPVSVGTPTTFLGWGFF